MSHLTREPARVDASSSTTIPSLIPMPPVMKWGKFHTAFVILLVLLLVLSISPRNNTDDIFFEYWDPEVDPPLSAINSTFNHTFGFQCRPQLLALHAGHMCLYPKKRMKGSGEPAQLSKFHPVIFIKNPKASSSTISAILRRAGSRR